MLSTNKCGRPFTADRIELNCMPQQRFLYNQMIDVILLCCPQASGVGQLQLAASNSALFINTVSPNLGGPKIVGG